MTDKWNFALHKVLILYLCGVVLGSEITLLFTKNVSMIAGISEITAMLLVTLAVIVSCRLKQNQ